MGTRKYSDGYRALRDADTPRRIAFDVLMQVERDGAFGNIALAKALRQARQHERIDARDAAFASELVNGTLRGRGRLDAVLARYLTRPIEELDLPVAVLLRLGAHQLLNMRVPDHAAVSTTVDLARMNLTDGPTRMVNAVLRSITREEEGAIEAALDQIEDPIERLGALTSHPTWMVEAFAQALTAHGYSPDELEALLEGDNIAPHVTLVARPGLIETEELAEEAEEVLDTRVAMGTVSSRAVLIESGDPAALESIRSGAAGVQDEGSQLSALIAAAAPLEGPDVSWLDLCAGPGGKAALLGALARQRQAHLVANELHPHRARLVERACRRLDNVDVVSSDGRSFGGRNTSWALGSFDRVIVDAPCSGMGSMRRRPESRWRRSQADVGELVILQAQLLRHARDLVRPGGVLTYITCSPHKEETVDQLEALLNEGGLELLDTVAIAEDLVPMSLEIPEGAGLMAGAKGRSLQLWEHRHGTDLMFIAALRRVGE